jgi:3'(2'), 5'-bisphosphate nucleotidase
MRGSHGQLIGGLREGIIAIARDAAAAILTVYDSEFAVEHKDDKSPLTAADLAAHHCIVAGWSSSTPDIPILSEESAEDVPASVRREWTRLWLVDPLDGTREFVKRNGEFTVNIALIDDGVPVLSVVQAPVTVRPVACELGRGAIRARWRQTMSHAHARPGDWRHCGRRQPLASRPRDRGLLEAHGRHRDRCAGFVAEILPARRRRHGRVSRASARPASGTPRPAQCVLEAAGGVVIDPDGAPLRYNQRDTILNGDFLALGDPRLAVARLAGTEAT